MSDVYRKFTITMPTRNPDGDQREWFLRYGVPYRIHSDQRRRVDTKIVTGLY